MGLTPGREKINKNKNYSCNLLLKCYRQSCVGKRELRTGDSFDIGNIEIPTGGQRSEEGRNIGGTLEAFAGLLVTLPVVNFQVDYGPT